MRVEVEVAGCGRLVGFVGFTDDQVFGGIGRSWIQGSVLIRLKV